MIISVARGTPCLLLMMVIPLYIDGMKNYNDNKAIHRELLEVYGVNVEA